jgi:hypothetical protein
MPSTYNLKDIAFSEVINILFACYLFNHMEESRQQEGKIRRQIASVKHA